MLSMKQLVTALACTALLSCASSAPQQQDFDAGSSVARPEIDLVQLVGPEEQSWPEGDLEIQYAMRIVNRAPEEIVLRQVEVETLGQGGPYAVKRDRYFFRVPIAAASTEDVTFWVRATSDGDRTAMDARSPITVRGIAYFDAGSGNFRRVFVKRIGQSAGR